MGQVRETEAQTKFSFLSFGGRVGVALQESGNSGLSVRESKCLRITGLKLNCLPTNFGSATNSVSR